MSTHSLSNALGLSAGVTFLGNYLMPLKLMRPPYSVRYNHLIKLLYETCNDRLVWLPSRTKLNTFESETCVLLMLKIIEITLM